MGFQRDTMTNCLQEKQTAVHACVCVVQCLQLVRVEVEEVQSRPGEAEGMDDTVDISLKEVRVFLDFSYVRKDRRCRVYVMEDFITAQVCGCLCVLGVGHNGWVGRCL